MLKNLLRQPDQKKLKKFRERLLEEAATKVAKLKRLISSPNSGWPEFVEILDDYKKHIEKRKALTSLDTADSATIDELKKLDHEKHMLNVIVGAVKKSVNKVEAAKLKTKQDELERERERIYGR